MEIPDYEGIGMIGVTVAEPSKAQVKGAPAADRYGVATGPGATGRIGPREELRIHPGVMVGTRWKHTRDGAES